MAIAKKMTQVTMQIMEALLGSDDLNDAMAEGLELRPGGPDQYADPRRRVCGRQDRIGRTVQDDGTGRGNGKLRL